MREITSKSNQNLKLIRTLKNKASHEYILIEGRRLIQETLRSEIELVKSFVSNDFAENNENEGILSQLDQKSETYTVPSKIFNSLSDTKTSQGIAAICKRPETSRNLIENALKQFTEKTPIVMCLNQISNPNNLGAVFRVAEAANVCGVILTKNSTDPFSPKANRSAMGSNLRLPIWHGEGFEAIVEWSKQNDLKTTCADITSTQSYVEMDWKKKRLLVFGSEAHGLSIGELELMEEKIKIPMANEVESLNIAVSTGIILFEAAKYG